jgi:class 3 adenylate cyclase
MFAFQLPFGSLNEARHAILPHDTPSEAATVRAPALDLPGRAEGAAAVIDAQLVRDGALDHERLLALLAAALREVDCGVVVCNSAERAPSFLVLGRRRAGADAGASPGIAFGNGNGNGAPARACERACAGDRSLLTLLFTDIVASTETAERLGDEAWRDLLDRHRAVVRDQLAAFRGVEIDNAGDGFFATFDAPARAVRCAEAIDVALAGIGISIRAGIHAGECAAVAGRVSGVAVHVAARIVEVAQPGEVLVSGTVRDLVAGSGLEFCDRDWHALKGLSGSRQLFALQRQAAP